MNGQQNRPAWSAQFAADALRELESIGPLSGIDRDWAWGGSGGEGIRVAVVDSGIESDHPGVKGAIELEIVIEYDPESEDKIRILPNDNPQDYTGHGTACAGIIHRIAPKTKIYSVRVLGKDLTAKAMQFAAGIRWAIEHEMHVVNLSLSTSRAQYYGLFHKLTDDAYFKNVILVSAVNNYPVPSYPSLYSSVISVAANDSTDPFTFYYNPSPPVEFGAPGIDIEVPWLNKSTCVTTGNSFASPHMTGIIALILAKHPQLTPFQVKTILYATASNTRAES
ncbi:MAG: S8 family serine peptidase [Anaerolineales bacterium]|jgi:subtilisin family serine protease